jgi:pyoluteorin transport system permease protein
VSSRAFPSRDWVVETADREAVSRGVGSSLRRVRALIRKEAQQLLRDRSNIGVGILLPLLLIVIVGGLSLDVKNVPVALVLEDSSPTAVELIASIQLSPYFSAVMQPSLRSAEQLMLAHKVDAVVRVQSDFARQLAAGRASVQVLIHGADANRARIIQGYVEGAIAQGAARRRNAGDTEAVGSVIVERRFWFNDINDTTYTLAPGLIALVMTLIGALLTSLVMAREWERGTLEALFATPASVMEIVLAKTIPYLGAGLVALALCLLATRFLFAVPLRGSVGILLLASILYLWVALGIGLLISSAARNQFIASQLALLTSFMPALMLSGFLFDLRSVPSGVRFVSRILPATYYVELLQTVFLAGNIWPLILRNCAVLALVAAVLFALVGATLRKSVA